MAEETQAQKPAPSNLSVILKWTAGALVMASLFALTLLGKVSVAEYTGLAYAALAALGVHSSIRN